MSMFSMRPYEGKSDLQKIAELINFCDSFDNLDEGTSVRELESELYSPDFDLSRDLGLWENEDGNLIAYAQLWISEPSNSIDTYLWFCVYPNHRSTLETDIIEWAIATAKEIESEKGYPVKLRANARENQPDNTNEILQNHGFVIDRYFFRMECSLTEFIPQPQPPSGFTVRPVNTEEDIEAWVELYSETFIDHWNYHPITVENLKHWLNEPDYRPDLNLVVISPDGIFAAFCFNFIEPEYNQRHQIDLGNVGALGVRRGFRNKGLGKSILLTSLHLLQSAGMKTARLAVDADNPNGALQLYKSLGFRQTLRRFEYVKES